MFDLESDKVTMNSLSVKLSIGEYTLSSSLTRAMPPTSANKLNNISISIPTTELLSPSTVYAVYLNAVECDYFIDERYLEILNPVNSFHFYFLSVNFDKIFSTY